MIDVEDIIINEFTVIMDVLKIIDRSSKQLAIVVDENKKLLGTISDGDIRRAILNNISLEDTVKNIYFKAPTVANINDSRETIINICASKKLHQIPIVDDTGNLVAPIPGMIIEYKKNIGDKVKAGDTIVVLEAMKMFNNLGAPCDGVVKNIIRKAGDSVAKGDILCQIESKK